MTSRLKWYVVENGGRVPDCDVCMRLLSNPMIRSACASVGISKNISTDQMLFEYLNVYHKKGHPRSEFDSEGYRPY